MINHTISYYYY